MELVGKRVKLRLMEETDAEALFYLIEENRELWTYLVRKLADLEDMKKIVAEVIEDYKGGQSMPNLEDRNDREKQCSSTYMAHTMHGRHLLYAFFCIKQSNATLSVNLTVPQYQSCLYLVYIYAVI